MVTAVSDHGTSRTQRGRMSSRASTMSIAEKTAMARSMPSGTDGASSPNDACAARATARKLLTKPSRPSAAARTATALAAVISPSVSGRARAVSGARSPAWS